MEGIKFTSDVAPGSSGDKFSKFPAGNCRPFASELGREGKDDGNFYSSPSERMGKEQVFWIFAIPTPRRHPLSQGLAAGRVEHPKKKTPKNPGKASLGFVQGKSPARRCREWEWGGSPQILCAPWGIFHESQGRKINLEKTSWDGGVSFRGRRRGTKFPACPTRPGRAAESWFSLESLLHPELFFLPRPPIPSTEQPRNPTPIPSLPQEIPVAVFWDMSG